MRTIIAEDHILYQEIVAQCCLENGHSVVGRFDSGITALDACFRLLPEFVILDLRLKDGPAGSMLEALERCEAPPRVLVISGYIAPYVVHRLDQLMVPTGFLHKADANVLTIKAAISALHRGERWLSAIYLEIQRRLRSGTLSFLKLLTDRQQQLLRYIAANVDDDEIAEKLGISSRTIEGHRSKLMHKLGLPNSINLAAYARENGFDFFPPQTAVPQPCDGVTPLKCIGMERCLG